MGLLDGSRVIKQVWQVAGFQWCGLFGGLEIGWFLMKKISTRSDILEEAQIMDWRWIKAKGVSLFFIC